MHGISGAGMPDSRLEAIFRRSRAGGDAGIFSLCSAHPLAITAGLQLAQGFGQLALVEATCNQVNQFGGYTGMRPADFLQLVVGRADALGIPADRVILGGDHLGPQPWRKEPAAVAMAKAVDLVREFVAAGFSKIHLDCSMRCADDPEILPEEIIADRAALMAEAAEAAAAPTTPPVYVIGTEVPPPGGMGSGHAIVPTDPAHVAETVETHRRAFAARRLEAAFERVVAVVVQPGVDFGNEEVVHFQPERSRALSAALSGLGSMVYEAHSTDYQLPEDYRALVAAHFAILKVGPAATFALREALYALEGIEAELVAPNRRSRLRQALETAMLSRPADWESHYLGPPEEQAYLRHFSYSDRLRYYWPEPAVQAAQAKLFRNLRETGLPLPLLSQYLPQHAEAVARGEVGADPEALAIRHVELALRPYAIACGRH